MKLLVPHVKCILDKNYYEGIEERTGKTIFRIHKKYYPKTPEPLDQKIVKALKHLKKKASFHLHILRNSLGYTEKLLDVLLDELQVASVSLDIFSASDEIKKLIWIVSFFLSPSQSYTNYGISWLAERLFFACGYLSKVF